MVNFGSLMRIRALLSRGALRIGKRPKMLSLPDIAWGKGHVRIGDRVSTRRGVVINAHGGVIELGHNVSLNPYTVLLGHGGIHIGDDVRIAAHVVIVSFEHGTARTDIPMRRQSLVKKPVVIENDVWIGAGAKVLAGAHIATGCVIGANAVVKGETVPYGIYAGVPARLVKMRGQEPEVEGKDPSVTISPRRLHAL